MTETTIVLPELIGSRNSVDRLLENVGTITDVDFIVDASKSKAAAISVWQQFVRRLFVLDNARSLKIIHPTRHSEEMIFRSAVNPSVFPELVDKVSVVSRPTDNDRV